MLDQLLPVIVGVNFYGFNKRLGRIADKGGSFDVQCDIGRIRSWLQASDLPCGIEDNADLKQVCDLLERPFISLNSTGTWIYSYLDFCLDTAEFQPVTGSVAINGPFDPDGATIKCSEAEGLPWFRFSTRWTLSIPLFEDRSKRSVMPKDLQAFASAVRSASYVGFSRR